MRFAGKFILSFLLHTTVADRCLICDYVGFADSEATALEMLSGVDAAGTASTLAPVCATVATVDPDFSEASLNGGIAKGKYSTVADKSYCIGLFFIYYAKDIQK